MSDIHCIIVEDEPLAVKILSDYISEVPFLELKGVFKDAILAIDWLRHNNIDLIFLDIHLPKLKGTAFLKTLTQPPAVIITTAYHQYAVEGFDLNVTDYLLKPFGFERFLVAVNKVKSALGMPRKKEVAEIREYLFLNIDRKRVKVLFSEIIYIESQREYVKIITIKHEYICKMSTHEIEELLPAGLFKRIHRSFIISIHKIESYSLESVQVNGVSVPIGRDYRNVIKDF